MLPEGPGAGNSCTHHGNLLMAHNFTRQGEGAILIVDESDDLLNTGGSDFFSMFFSPRSSAHNKSWLDYFMDQPGTRCIWITNDTTGLEQSVKRRFAFSLHFPRLGYKEREKIWQRSCQEHHSLGADRLPVAAISVLAKKFAVSAGVIDQALVKSLEAVNSSPPASGILLQVTRWRDWNKDKNKRCRRSFTLLFHGRPGTGKTELARYLAHTLDLELMQRRASDIFAPHVGESEQNVAEMFREAEARGAILLLDELESFFISRDKAHQMWEFSVINEFLTRLENFTGLFLGSTNRLNDLDPAAIRRFSQKVEFNSLSFDGRLELFESMLQPLSTEGLSKGERQCLEDITVLTAGDFKVAADLFRWSHPGTVSNLELIEALKAETGFRDEPQAENIVSPRGAVN